MGPEKGFAPPKPSRQACRAASVFGTSCFSGNDGVLLLAGNRQSLSHALSSRSGNLCRSSIFHLAIPQSPARLPQRVDPCLLHTLGAFTIHGHALRDWLCHSHVGKDQHPVALLSRSTFCADPAGGSRSCAVWSEMEPDQSAPALSADR